MKKVVLFIIIIFPICFSCSDATRENRNADNSIYGYWKQYKSNEESGDYILEFNKDSLLITIYGVFFNDKYYIEKTRLFNVISENQVVIDNRNLFYKIENGKLSIYDENRDIHYQHPFIRCDKPKPLSGTIPNQLVSLALDLNFGDTDLIPALATKSITKLRGIGDRGVGFGGVLIIHGFSSNGGLNFFAYDLACPYEADNNVLVIPDDEGKARCPKCGSVYVTMWGTGIPDTQSVSKYPLLPYYVQSAGGNTYVVRNFY